MLGGRVIEKDRKKGVKKMSISGQLTSSRNGGKESNLRLNVTQFGGCEPEMNKNFELG